MEETITMYISGDGQVEIETSGYHGKQCEKTTNQLLVSLGGQVTDQNKKPEYYDPEEDPVKILTL